LLEEERVELKEFLMEGSDSEKGDVKNNGDQSTKVKEANLKDECTVNIKKNLKEVCWRRKLGETGRLRKSWSWTTLRWKILKRMSREKTILNRILFQKAKNIK